MPTVFSPCYGQWRSILLVPDVESMISPDTSYITFQQKYKLLHICSVEERFFFFLCCPARPTPWTDFATGRGPFPTWSSAPWVLHGDPHLTTFTGRPNSGLSATKSSQNATHGRFKWSESRARWWVEGSISTVHSTWTQTQVDCTLLLGKELA